MAVLPLFGPPNILENNIVATGASAGSSISAGAIFTLPALILLHHWSSFDYWWTLAIVGLGGLLGVLFSVPLAAHADHRAEAAVPRRRRRGRGAQGGRQSRHRRKISGDRGPRRRRVQVGHVGACAGCPRRSRRRASSVDAGIAFFGYGFSPALLAVGYIVGLNVAILIAAGGLFSWWLAIPLYNSFFFDHDPALAHKLIGLDAENAAFAIWRAQVRYIGVGCMLTGALWALWSLRKSLWSAIRSGLKVGGKQIRRHTAHGARFADGPVSSSASPCSSCRCSCCITWWSAASASASRWRSS